MTSTVAALETACQREEYGGAELARHLADIQRQIERLAARIDGIARTAEQHRQLAAYVPAVREDGTSQYDAAARAERLSAAVCRRLGIDR